jgi:hypothetical protein
MENFKITIADNGYIVENLDTNTVSVYQGEDIPKEMYEELLQNDVMATLVSMRAQLQSSDVPVQVKFTINIDYTRVQ